MHHRSELKELLQQPDNLTFINAGENAFFPTKILQLFIHNSYRCVATEINIQLNVFYKTVKSTKIVLALCNYFICKLVRCTNTKTVFDGAHFVITQIVWYSYVVMFNIFKKSCFIIHKITFRYVVVWRTNQRSGWVFLGGYPSKYWPPSKVCAVWC
jgi:hypothetical protein